MIQKLISLVLYNALLLSFPVQIAWAVSPVFWNTSSMADFAKGTLKGLSISSEGRILLAPKFESVFDSDQALIWSAVYDSKKNLYVGTGHDGKVFKIDSKGTSNLFFDAPELDVLALALDVEQNIYAATSPDGKIYKVNTEGKGNVFFDPDDKFIWDLAFDQKGNLYAATGIKGKVYKINKEGKGDVFYDSQETNLICLTIDANANIIAGSDPNGYVYRISPDGKPFVLYDSGMREIHEVQVDSQGDIYFIAMNAASGSSFPEPKSTTPELVSGDPVAVGLSLSVTADKPDKKTTDELPAQKGTSNRSSRREASNLKSGIYCVRKDNTVDTLWTSENESAYGILPQTDGKILFSTGTKGKIYSLDKEKKLTLLLETTEEQTTKLIPAGKEIFVCTSNLAKIYRLSSALSPQGSYESETKDTQSTSTWGSINWRAIVPTATSIKVYTRTGNTRKPDRTWSEWSKAYTHPDGDPVESPKARYIQYKVVLDSATQDSPGLDQISIPYLQQNFPPEVKSIAILPPGVAFQRLSGFPTPRSQSSLTDQGAAEASGASEAIPQQVSASVPPRRVFQKGTQSISWEAEDRNGDDLVYSAFFRGEKESDWKLLKKDVEDKFLTLESDTLPDGKYLIRVIASDSLSNPKATSLTGELTSTIIDIDNTPPQIQVLNQTVQSKSAAIRFKASDTVSALRKAEFSLDGKDWEVVFSIDGIIDSKEEEFEVRTEPLDVGEHTVALRVYDSTGNVGIAKALCQIK
jgi:predicted nucleic acid-binding protein